MNNNSLIPFSKTEKLWDENFSFFNFNFFFHLNVFVYFPIRVLSLVSGMHHFDFKRLKSHLCISLRQN